MNMVYSRNMPVVISSGIGTHTVVAQNTHPYKFATMIQEVSDQEHFEVRVAGLELNL